MGHKTLHTLACETLLSRKFLFLSARAFEETSHTGLGLSGRGVCAGLILPLCGNRVCVCVCLPDRYLRG